MKHMDFVNVSASPSSKDKAINDGSGGTKAGWKLSSDGIFAVASLLTVFSCALFLFLTSIIIRYSFLCVNKIRRSPKNQEKYYDKAIKDVPCPLYDTLDEWQLNMRDICLSKDILGKGRFTEVFSGFVSKSGKERQQAAIKVIKEFSTRAAFCNINRELEIMKKVGSHPNVIALIGICSQDDTLYIALELLTGGNLLNVLRSLRNESPNVLPLISMNEDSIEEKMLQVAFDVAQGMQYLASVKVILVSLTARSILISGDFMAKISDFGRSRAEGIRRFRSRKGNVLDRWMALESLLNHIYSEKSDVWSFGVFLWEIATLGTLPYQGYQWQQVLEIVKGGFRLQQPKNCSDDIYHIMTKCWGVEPEQRPGFGELIQILASVINAEPKSFIIKFDPAEYDICEELEAEYQSCEEFEADFMTDED